MEAGRLRADTCGPGVLDRLFVPQRYMVRAYSGHLRDRDARHLRVGRSGDARAVAASRRLWARMSGFGGFILKRVTGALHVSMFRGELCTLS